MPTPREPRLAALAPLPPKEALEFFRQKGFKIGFDHRDVWQSEHQASFTVAKAMQMDLLHEIREQVDAAIELGIPFQEFRDTLRPRLMQRGWWGRALMDDPVTGETKEVQLGSTRRLKTIYDTNLRTAHCEAQWDRIQEGKEDLPFLMYDHLDQKHPRPEHKDWDGKVLPVDDPWWQSHFPVRAYNCKCRAIPMNQRQLDRAGKKVGTAPPEKYVDYVNKRTGEKSRVPVGVDPAFNYPPGGRRASLVNHLASRVEQLAPNLRPAAAQSIAGEAFAAWSKKPAGDWPIGVLPPTYVAALAVETDIVRLSADTMTKQLREHPEIKADEYKYVQDALDRGVPIQEAERVLIFLLEEAGYVTVVKATQSGRAAFLMSFRRLSSEAAKREREIERLLKKGQK